MNFKINDALKIKLESQSAAISDDRVKELLEYCDNDWNILNELFDLYFSILTENLTMIHQAKKSSNSENLRTSAHKLKSSSKNVGFQRIGSICEWLENTGRAGNVNGIQEELALLESECKGIQGLATQYISTKKAA